MPLHPRTPLALEKEFARIFDHPNSIFVHHFNSLSNRESIGMMSVRAATAMLVKEVEHIRIRHLARTTNASGVITHEAIKQFFDDVDTLRRGLTCVNMRNCDALTLLSSLYDEMFCTSDALQVRRIRRSLFKLDKGEDEGEDCSVRMRTALCVRVRRGILP